MSQKPTIQLSPELFEQLEKMVSQSASFESVSDYVDFILREVIFGESEEPRQASESAVRQRLKDLGYL